VGGVVFDIVLGAAVAVAAWEFGGLMRRIHAAPPPWLLYPLTTWLLFRALLPAGVPALEIGLGAGVVVGLLGGLVWGRPAGASWATVGAALTGALYLGLCGGYYIALFRWHVPDPHREGARIVGVILAAAMVGDTAAYLVGSRLGRRPFFAALSPKKTVEGALAGLIGTVLVVAAAGPALLPLHRVDAIVLGVLVGVAAQGGDLVESALKRQAGVKDSSALIPGHGGLLDRLDSLLFIGPVVYCFFRVVALP